MSQAETTAGALRQSPGAQPILLAIGFALLIVISAASIWLADQSNDDTEAVEHTLDVQNRMSLILLNLRRAESAQRGFILTGQPPYREEYRIAADNTPVALENAKTATADNPQQVARLQTLTPLIRDKLEEMERVIGLYDQGRLPEAQDVIRAGAAAT